ncbi:MAG: hypothetical protein JNJ73_12950 [Hyphomonadaceae bacterium]|nr:hypothetical protein [Hyphomonadaceae bacterium]
MDGLKDDARRAERDVLLTYVRMARGALCELSPSDIRARKLPSAMNQIGLIVETTESAANQIMDQVSEILALPGDISPGAYREAVEARCMSLMEACAFQDLTGQRSTKVIETLLHIEHKLGKLAHLLGDEGDAPPEEPEADVLLNGPAMPGEGVDQDEIDRMFG